MAFLRDQCTLKTKSHISAIHCFRNISNDFTVFSSNSIITLCSVHLHHTCNIYYTNTASSQVQFLQLAAFSEHTLQNVTKSTNYVNANDET